MISQFLQSNFCALTMNSIAVMSLTSFCPIIFNFPPSVAHFLFTLKNIHMLLLN